MFKSETQYTKFDGKKHKDVKPYLPDKEKENRSLVRAEDIQSSHDYRQYLIRNGTKIMDRNHTNYKNSH